jgi:tetratricopeptide (TPR) repeat protein
LELDPNFISAHFYLGYAYLHKDMYKEAIAEFEKELVIFPDRPRDLAALGDAYAVSGRRAEAEKVLNQLTELSNGKYVQALGVAIAYAGLGKEDKAFEWLEKGYQQRSIGSINVEPAFDPLRSDPRFADLLRRMNLQP